MRYFWIHKYENAHDKVHAFEQVWIRKWQGQMTTKANETAPSDKRVLAVLHRMIMDGSLAPGSKISEVSVADMFDVSRTPARLALRALEVEGLIKKRDGRGFTVQEFNLGDIKHAYEVARCAGGPGCRHACQERHDQGRRGDAEIRHQGHGHRANRHIGGW